MSEAPILAAHGLAIGFPGRRLASDIAFALRPGTVTCLLGPNGVGKTTLMRTMLGLHPALEGRVEIGGRNIAAMARREIAQAIAFVPQAHAGPFAHTALDLVMMGRTARLGLFQQPGACDEAIAREAMATLGIAALVDRGIDRLSGGQRQLVFIARALAQQAGTLVMDEPASSLDIANRLLLRRRVRSLADNGLAILISTHEPDEALALGDFAATIGAQGFAHGSVRDVLTGEALSRLYATPLQVEATASGRSVVSHLCAEPAAASNYTLNTL